MNTGKVIKNQHATHHTTNDENSYIPVNLLKNTGNIGGKINPQVKDITRLQEVSLMNNTYFGAIQNNIQPDMKLDFTISRFFKKCLYQNYKHYINYANLKEHKFYNRISRSKNTLNRIFIIRKQIKFP